MSETTYLLVEANLAYARASLDDPMMADFVSRLDEIDALAQSWPGFVAQPTLPDEGQVYSESAMLNVSIWRSVEDVRTFTYSREHTDLLDRRAEWFVQSDRPAYVLYWAHEGETPTEAEIQRRFAHLQEHGPTAYAFRRFGSKRTKTYAKVSQNVMGADRRRPDHRPDRNETYRSD